MSDTPTSGKAKDPVEICRQYEDPTRPANIFDYVMLKAAGERMTRPQLGPRAAPGGTVGRRHRRRANSLTAAGARYPARPAGPGGTGNTGGRARPLGISDEQRSVCF